MGPTNGAMDDGWFIHDVPSDRSWVVSSRNPSQIILIVRDSGDAMRPELMGAFRRYIV